MRSWPLVLLVLAPVLSGCLSDDGGDKNPTMEDPDVRMPVVNPIELGHDHNDPTVHTMSNNINLIGHHPLGAEGPPGSISEIDVAGDYAFLGVMGHGFMIMDISDPTAPEMLSSVEVASPDQLTPAGAYLADLKVDQDGDWVFVALELSTTPGVLIYDARDKENPVLAGFWPEPGLLLGCHMIEYAVIGEEEYLFCAPLDNAVYVGRILPPVAGVREIVQVARWMPTTQKFAEQQGAVVSGYIQDQNVVGAALHFVSGHQDMTHQKDPLDGRDILSVSFWNLGLRFVDVTNPALPLEIGSWAGEEATKWDGVLHTSMMFESEGRRIAVTTPEGARPPAMFVMDATDYDNPVLLSEWTALPDFEGEDGRFSLHNFQVVNGRVYLAMYHGGTWVLDISTPELQAAPEVLGTYLPWDRTTDRGCCGGSWDVVVWEGDMITANRGGMYVTHLVGDPTDNPDWSGFA